MGTIRITQDMATLCLAQVKAYLAHSAAYGNLVIYQGVKPTHANHMYGNSNVSQYLIVYDSFSGDTVQTDNTMETALNYVNAAASGEATWFAFRGYFSANTNAFATGVEFRYSVIGDVGLPGSGADLVISNTTVVAGTPYNVGPFKMTLPQTYTF